MKYSKIKTFSVGILLIATIAVPSFAIDNPDVPDYLGEFAKKTESYEAKVSKSAGNSSLVLDESKNYEKFLDGELNDVYGKLIRKLKPENKKLLQISQKKWLLFRDEEFKFIGENWTIAQFGSSATLSLGQYRCSVIRERVKALLTYLVNY